jgi:hypothetical protein
MPEILEQQLLTAITITLAQMNLRIIVAIFIYLDI